MKWITLLLMSSIIYIGSGNGNSSETQQFFDRLITPPTGLRESVYAGLIDELNATDVWTKLDFLQVYAAADFPTAVIDLKGSATGMWPFGFGAFVANEGISPLGSTASFDTGFNLSTATNFKQNDACFFGWNLSVTAIPGYGLGGSNAPETHISPFNNNVSDHTQWAINSSSEVDSGVIASDASGFWLMQRTGATTSVLYLNGTQVATSNVSSTVPSNANLGCGTNNNAKWALVGAGASLSAIQLTQLYNILRQYLQRVGQTV